MSNEDYRDGYRDGFKDGFEQANKKKDMTPWLVPIPDREMDKGCCVCGLKFDGPYGYVCPRLDCPSNFTVYNYGTYGGS